MNYEQVANKNGNGGEIVRAVKDKALGNISTSAIVWHLVKRHKFTLVSVYALIVSVLYFLPFTGDLLRAALLGL